MEWEFLDRELCISTPKSLLNPPRTGSKTERHGVQKTLVERILRGFLLFKTSKMVTFGHHFENGGPKKRLESDTKKCPKIRFLRRSNKK